MAWQQLVIRKDSPLRHQLAAVGIMDSASKNNIFNSPALENIRVDRWWWDSDGTVQIDMGQLRSLMGGYIGAFKQSPQFLLSLAGRYRKIAKDWIEKMEQMQNLNYKQLNNNRLLELFDVFCEGALQSNTMLMPPFAVERLNAGDDYRNMLTRIANEIITKIEKEVINGNGSFSRFYLAHIDDKPQLNDVVNKIIKIIDFSCEKTFTEQKELALLKLAAEIYKNKELVARFLQPGFVPILQKINEISTELAEQIDQLVSEHGWINQWGYPPFYNPYSFDDFAADLIEKLKNDPSRGYEEALIKQKKGKAVFDYFREHISLQPNELALIETINEYNFLRTWRMEVVMKCQYLSLPLLREIERRAIVDGKLHFNDIFLLMSPEIHQYLTDGTLPAGIDKRRDGWVMTMRKGDVEIWVGDAAEQERENYYSILDYREKARGKYSIEASNVGGKAGNLYGLLNMKLPIPKFFVVTTEAYRAFLRKNKLTEKIIAKLKQYHLDSDEQRSKASDADMLKRLADFESDVRTLFEKCHIPSHIAAAILSQQKELDLNLLVVRSSASVEDSSHLSWAGRFQSYLYVKPEQLLSRVKDVWASQFSTTAMQYAFEHGQDPLKIEMAVIIQDMLEPTASGVINTSWSLEVRDVMEIEAVWGQCSTLVSGELTPDTYLVRKDKSLDIFDVRQSEQEKFLSAGGMLPVPDEKKGGRKLSESQVKHLAELALSVENNLEFPQDIEWAMVGEAAFFVQTRPITGTGDATGANETGNGETGKQINLDAVTSELILIGQKGKVSSRIAGKAYVAETLQDAKYMEPGAIMIISAATPNWDPVLMKAAAVISNEGGATCHAIRVANERSIPAVVGTGKATKVIKSGDQILVDTTDPFRGKVYLLSQNRNKPANGN
jgi:phosphohistidine swiveling domain-containing protein